MSKPRLPTLKQITGERPRCQFCGKDLKPETCSIELKDHITEPPETEELLRMPQPRPSYPSTQDAVQRGYCAEFVFRMTHRADWKNEAFTILRFWTGKFDGHGYTDTPQLFCNQECGLLFGLAAWRAGYRMKGRSDG